MWLFYFWFGYFIFIRVSILTYSPPPLYQACLCVCVCVCLFLYSLIFFKTQLSHTFFFWILTSFLDFISVGLVYLLNTLLKYLVPAQPCLTITKEPHANHSYRRYSLSSNAYLVRVSIHTYSPSPLYQACVSVCVSVSFYIRLFFLKHSFRILFFDFDFVFAVFAVGLVY